MKYLLYFTETTQLAEVTTEKLVEVQTTLQEEMTTESVREETTSQALDTTLKPGEHSRDPYNAGLFQYKTWKPKGLFHFNIIINVLVGSLRFI